MSQTLVQKLFSLGRTKPDHLALIIGDRHITYGRLITEIWSVKSRLELQYDVTKEDSVMLFAEKNESFVFLYYALHLIGAKTIPLDNGISKDRISFIVNSMKPRFVIGINEKLEGVLNLDLNEFIDVSHTRIPSEVDYPHLNSIADVMFTSGTTGAPKGVLLTQKNIAQSAENINDFIGNSIDDVELLALPMSHSFGLGRLRCVLSAGGTLVLHASSVNVKRLFRKIEEHAVTGFSMVPSSWKYLRKLSGDKIGQYRNQLKYIELGSAYLSPEDKFELAQLLPKTRLCMHYGLTEASRSAFLEFNGDRHSLHTVGRACKSVEIKIFDDSGSELPSDCEGEICIAGDHVAKSFVNVDDSQFFQGKYFRTGDIGILNRQGFLEFRGRTKDIVNVGGKKLSPQEIENKLIEWEPGIDAACVGIINQDSILGEEVKLFIVEGSTAKTFNDINKYLKDNLEDYKVPRHYEWIYELPRTSSGKIQRQKLK